MEIRAKNKVKPEHMLPYIFKVTKKHLPY